MGLNILSCGLGTISSALALISCESKRTGIPHPHVPVYDYIMFCDLGEEPPWVYEMRDIVAGACEDVGIPFINLTKALYQDYMDDFGYGRTVSIPFWSIDENNVTGRMPRNCTLDYKIQAMQDYIRYAILGYKKYERVRPDDNKSHRMHIGFSAEEARRCKDNPHNMFENKYPLIDMDWRRADCYGYIYETTGYKARASACNICPFHRNYFFKHLKEHHPDSYEKVVAFDNMLEERPHPKLKSKLYISRSRKRIQHLEDHECDDAETFNYNGEEIWNGF